MKRNYLFKNMGRLSLVIGLLATTLLSSCLKDNSPGSIDFSKSPALVGFQYKGFSATPYVAVALPQPGVKYNLEVTLSVASVTLSKPVTVTIAEDKASLDAYNTANGTSYVELPAADYSLPNGGVVTINPGQQIVQFPITLAGDQIDFTTNPALALKMISASGATIASNLNVAMVILKVKSLYEDTYTVISGATTRYKGGSVGSGVRDVFAVSETSLFYSTYTANTVIGQAGSSAFGLSVAITINGTVVTVGADPTSSATFNYTNGDSQGASSYDPATKTLTLHYSYLNAAGALREVDMVLKGQ
jgi:hypothetical protein